MCCRELRVGASLTVRRLCLTQGPRARRWPGACTARRGRLRWRWLWSVGPHACGRSTQSSGAGAQRASCLAAPYRAWRGPGTTVRLCSCGAARLYWLMQHTRRAAVGASCGLKRRARARVARHVRRHARDRRGGGEAVRARRRRVQPQLGLHRHAACGCGAGRPRQVIHVCRWTCVNRADPATRRLWSADLLGEWGEYTA